MVGIKAPSIYAHFKGKEELLGAVMDWSDEEYAKGMGLREEAEGAVDCVVEVHIVLCLGRGGQVFTDTVIDDHHVVDGVTDHGQDSRDELLVNFH